MNLLFLSKIKAKMVFLYVIICTSLLGLVNLLLNYSQVSAAAKETSVPVIAVFIGVPFIAAATYVFYVIALSLLSYFSAAAIQKGRPFSDFVGFSIKALWAVPLITLSDSIGFLICNKKFTDFGWIGLLSYLPFYLFTAVTVYSLLPKSIEVKQGQRVVLSILFLIAIVVLSLPNLKL